MVAYSFKRSFVEPIRAGTKSHTIRPDRKRHARPGEELQLYCAMRTKCCFLIGRTSCSGVQPIHLDFSRQAVTIGAAVLDDTEELDRFARSDGFVDWSHMRAFWFEEHNLFGTHGRWAGVIIDWKDLSDTDAPIDPRLAP